VNDGRWEVVASGAKWPVWSADGRELFYQSGQSIHSVRVDASSGSLKWSTPQALFGGTYIGFAGLSGSRGYDIAPDGRFLLIKSVPTAEVTRSEIVVVQNWLAEPEASN
jgi:hypothetical protein